MSSIGSFSDSVQQQVKNGNVVFTAPTGAGKSTLLPQWLRVCGKVLVIEPRRIAAQALAVRVADLMGSRLGDRVGYQVRDESKWGDQTEILFVTTGIALRLIASNRHKQFNVVMLDEFHERSLDLELLLALLHKERFRLVICSATLAAQEIADHINAKWIHADLRPFEVRIHHVGQNRLPTDESLSQRIKDVVQEITEPWRCLLVFLPGKAEIRRCSAIFSASDFEILTLDGSQNLAQQKRVFEKLGSKSRIVLSTNIAETSLTIPQVDGVIDSGLVRRTRYYGGRGFLTLLPIALDSALQRSGRAGRTKAGFAVRLWSNSTALTTHTIPEIRRASLTQLLLASMACGFRPESLPFLEPPPRYALDDATEQLRRLRAIDVSGNITSTGRALFEFPLDPFLNGLIIQAKKEETLGPILYVCSVLSTKKAFFCGRSLDPEDDIRKEGCDLMGMIRALSLNSCPVEQVFPAAWDASFQTLKRLESVFGKANITDMNIKNVRVTILRAWPKCAHVRRQRKRQVSWANGGTEKSLSNASAIKVDKAEAILGLSTIALSGKRHHAEAMITLATPIDPQLLYTEGKTRAVLERVKVYGDTINCVYTHRYAKRIIRTIESSPPEALVIPTLVEAILGGRWHSDGGAILRKNFNDQSLAAAVSGDTPWPTLEEWLTKRFETLGVVEISDIALLEDGDWRPEPLDEFQQRQLRKKYPQRISTGDALYHLEYEPSERRCRVVQQSGLRKQPPDLKNLPRLNGWRFFWVYKNRTIPMS